MASPPIRTEIHCFIYLHGGEITVRIGEEIYRFGAGECAIIPAGQVFSILDYIGCEGYMGGFHTDFLNADNEGKNLLRTFGFLRKWGSHKVSFDESHAAYAGNIFRRLDMEFSHGNNKVILKAYLTTLLVEIDEALKRSDEISADVNTDNELCNSFMEYLFDNPALDTSVAGHASRLNVSSAHLQKTVKTLTGKTVTEWISDAVIMEAKVMLVNTEIPVSDIGAALGVQDPSYFSRLFKKHTGCTPRAYRDSKNTRKT